MPYPVETKKGQTNYVWLDRYFIKKLVGILFLLAVIFLKTSSNVYASTYTVTKTADTNDGTCDADCSLREAVATANSNSGADTVELPSGTFLYSSQFDITDSLTIQGQGIDSTIISRSSGSTRAFNVATANLTISITGVTISNANINSNGGGMLINATGGTSTVNITNTKFLDNVVTTTGTGRGAGIAILNTNIAVVTVSDSQFVNNQAGRGAAAITFYPTSSGGSLTITNSTFSGNTASTTTGGDGGAISINNATNTTVSIDNSTFSDNIGVWGSAFTTWKDLTSLSVTNSTFTNNTVRAAGVDFGTGVTMFLSSAGTTSTTITGNTFTGGNSLGFFINHAYNSLTVSNNTFQNLTKGVYIALGDQASSTASTTIFSNNSFLNNSSHGLHIDQDGTVPRYFHVTSNTLTGNSGDGIFVDEGVARVKLSQNVIHDNTESEIDVAPNGISTNDSGDSDAGPNDLMNYPVIEFVEYQGGDRFWVHGNLDGNSSEAPFTIEVCKSSDHSSGHGGCSQSLGTTTISSPGAWDMNVSVSGASSTNLMSFTALATNANGSTSEFSQNIGGRVPVTGVASPRQPSYIASAPLPSTISTMNDVTSIVNAGVFKYDAYFDVTQTPKTSIYNIPNTFYWQASPKLEVWWRSFFNDAKILSDEVVKPFTLVFAYHPEAIEKNLPINNLRIAFSDDGKKWKILSNSIHNKTNKTLAVVTKNGGYYMLVSGYPTTQIDQTKKDVQGTKTEVTPTLTPTPIPTPIPTATPTQPPQEKNKRCLWFICF